MTFDYWKDKEIVKDTPPPDLTNTTLKVWLKHRKDGETSIVSIEINTVTDMANALKMLDNKKHRVISFQLVYRPNEVK